MMFRLSMVILLLLAGCASSAAPLPDKRSEIVEGHKLEYAMAGQGKPVVVFLNGFGCEMASWEKVYPEVGKFATVFAYNRLGTGESDSPDQPQTASVIVETLRALLKKKALSPPYILVGHSAGGLYANLFAREYPQDVAGVVLVDSPTPDREVMWRQRSNSMQFMMNKAVEAIYGLLTPSRLTSEWTLLFSESAQQIRDARQFPDIPLIVITAGIDEIPFWAPGRNVRIQIHQDGQRYLTAMSLQGKQVIAAKSGHFVMENEPGLVIQAIRDEAN